ncbi:hypothetical protein TVAG_136650 [Trichomonas vaginalis G3]|uniref:Uncharacterized protein n=1 Tax=Trichomonas vaginalis (strain ATCC PRA-98 / G3) TaxID=412133 RepID=A2DJE7_TRIV3|nr:hypothetical protein TVAGG3_0543200 [Trichomonas vaginalis G3]EAY19534.1 hypothetical protein TVAG_136650 [Trichomonas vaginalis G3]KAI5519984.1 hypothetical protein TVAGG3_0543200 [Trichomonas vaginalis G3]|eukprot:XP_001580520.1 hypothetical protein [Trichomonas vaginalis G3]
MLCGLPRRISEKSRLSDKLYYSILFSYGFDADDANEIAGKLVKIQQDLKNIKFNVSNLDIYQYFKIFMDFYKGILNFLDLKGITQEEFTQLSRDFIYCCHGTYKNLKSFSQACSKNIIWIKFYRYFPKHYAQKLLIAGKEICVRYNDLLQWLRSENKKLWEKYKFRIHDDFKENPHYKNVMDDDLFNNIPEKDITFWFDDLDFLVPICIEN